MSKEALPLMVRMEIGAMKAQVVAMIADVFRASGDKARLEKLVDEAIKEFDFAGEVRSIVHGKIKSEIDEKIGWMLHDKVRTNEVMRRIDKMAKRLEAEVRIELGLD